MKVEKTAIEGAYILELPRFPDDRGHLDILFSRQTCEKAGLPLPMAQTLMSWNRQAATLRGIHYQAAPRTEIKLVTCLTGSVYDVVVDLRKDSPTFKQWFGVELSAANHRAVYLPEGMGHGYLTLEAGAAVIYHTSQPYDPALARGVMWNDPALNIQWPIPPRVLSPRDNEHPPLDPALCL